MGNFNICDKPVQLLLLLNFPSILQNKFFLIAGVVASFFPALLSVSTNLLLGVLNADTWLYSLAVWWIGGALGVVIFTPIILILFARPKSNWRNRAGTVVVPMMVLFLVLLFIFPSEQRHTSWELVNI
jgi:integral membrane sensor domain MASE1